MSRSVVVVAAVCGLAAGAGAQVSITQNVDPTFVSGGSIACVTDPNNPPQRSAENSYYRSFDLTSYPAITGDFLISDLDFAIENATHPDTEQDVFIFMYRDTNGGAPMLADLELLGEAVFVAEDQTLTLVNQEIEACALQDDTLVVEIMTEDYTMLTAAAVFFIGSNPFGQSDPSFIRAPTCGATEISDLATVGPGFPDMHIIMQVNGDIGECPALCYADCDGNETLDVFDFLCFQDAFVQGDPYADCDGNTVLDVFDFLCFQDAFVVGCP
jgi:hypothetical protein